MLKSAYRIYYHSGALFIVALVLAVSVLYIGLSGPKDRETDSEFVIEPPIEEVTLEPENRLGFGPSFSGIFETADEILFEAQGTCSVSSNEIAIDTVEQQMANIVNSYRIQNGFASLPLNSTLTKTAAWMAVDTAAKQRLDPNHIDSQGRNWLGRLADCGYSGFGVDILASNANPDPVSTLNLWKASPSHNMTILNQVADAAGGAPHIKNWAGMGIARVFNTPYWYWVIYFGEVNDGSGSPPSGPAPTNPPTTPDPPNGGSTVTPTPFCGGSKQLHCDGVCHGLSSDKSNWECVDGKAKPKGSGTKAPSTIDLTVDKTTYNVGEKIGACFSVANTAYFKLREIDQNTGSTLRVSLQINFFGSGSGCLQTFFAEAPIGNKCLIMERFASSTDSTVTETKQACYQVVDSNANQPIDTPTATPIPQATNTPIPGQPTATPTATPTLAPGSGGMKLVIKLPGIGPNAAIGENHPILNFVNGGTTRGDGEFIIRNVITDQILPNFGGAYFYVPASATFELLISGSSGVSLAPATYEVKTKLANTLWKNIGQANVNASQVLTLPTVVLVPGDLNQDNVLDLADYNIILSCFGTKQCNQKQNADFNMDGKVDEKDLNIFYDGLAKRVGD